MLSIFVKCLGILCLDYFSISNMSYYNRPTSRSGLGDLSRPMSRGGLGDLYGGDNNPLKRPSSAARRIPTLGPTSSPKNTNLSSVGRSPHPPKRLITPSKPAHHLHSLSVTELLPLAQVDPETYTAVIKSDIFQVQARLASAESKHKHKNKYTTKYIYIYNIRQVSLSLFFHSFFSL